MKPLIRLFHLMPFSSPGSTIGAAMAIAVTVLAVLWAPAEEDRGEGAGAAAADTEGSKKLWGALVFAVNDPEAKRHGFKDAEAEMAETLRRAFKNYKHFQVLGTRAETLFKSTHSWVAPSKELCVKFDSKGLTDGGVRLDVQLWSRGKAIVKTDAIFKPGSPVFIEGPPWGEGRLLYMLELWEDGESEAAAASEEDAGD